jgi:nucleoside-diphosphate-sugar epimerase
MTKSIVTGAAGFIGSHLADRLLDLDHQVVGVDCFTDYYARPLKDDNIAHARSNASFRLVEGDLLDLDLDALLHGVDYVFHVAGQAGVRASWGTTFAEYVRNNITATQRLLEAAKGSAIAKLVYSSSSSVYGDAKELPVTEETLPRPVSPYGVTKLAAEHLCSLYARLYGLPAVSLRLFTVYGPRQRPDMAIQRFLSAALGKETLTIFGDGMQTRDFTFVGDVIEAHVLATKAPPDERIFNVCGGSQISVNELLALVQEVTGRTLRVEYAEAARGDARHTLGDHSRARRALGFRPRVRPADGVAAQWQWLHESGRGEYP